MSERILVTGGAGYIGSNITAALLKRPATDVVVVDDFSSGDWRNLIHVDCEVRAADCDDPFLLEEIADGGFSAIYHQAAITDTTVMDQRLMVEINTNAFASILEASSISGTRVTYASSAGTYGNSPAPNRIGFGEEPENIYGFSKLAMDRIAYRWHDRHPAPIIGLRYFNVFGERQSLEDEYAVVIPKFITCMLKNQPPPIHGDGKQSRDFTYVANVVEATLLAVRTKEAAGLVFNVGCGKEYSILDLVATLNKILGTKLEPVFTPTRPGDVPRTLADISRATKILGDQPKTGFEEGLRRAVSYFKNK